MVHRGGAEDEPPPVVSKNKSESREVGAKATATRADRKRRRRYTFVNIWSHRSWLRAYALALSVGLLRCRYCSISSGLYLFFPPLPVVSSSATPMTPPTGYYLSSFGLYHASGVAARSLSPPFRRIRLTKNKSESRGVGAKAPTPRADRKRSRRYTFVNIWATAHGFGLAPLPYLSASFDVAIAPSHPGSGHFPSVTGGFVFVYACDSTDRLLSVVLRTLLCAICHAQLSCKRLRRAQYKNTLQVGTPDITKSSKL